MGNVDFNPIGAAFTSHPCEFANSPFLTLVNRVASEQVDMLGSQMIIVSHPTTSSNRAADVYHIDSSGNYILREKVDYSHDLADTSLRKCVVSFASTVQCTTVSATLATIAGAENASITTTPLTEWISFNSNLGSSELFPSGIATFRAGEVLKINNTQGFAIRGAPIASGVASMMVFPDDIFSDVKTPIPLFNSSNISSGSGFLPIDMTDASQMIFQGVSSEAFIENWVEGTTQSFSTPWLPLSLGDGVLFTAQLNIPTVTVTVAIGSSASLWASFATITVSSLTGSVIDTLQFATGMSTSLDDLHQSVAITFTRFLHDGDWPLDVFIKTDFSLVSRFARDVDLTTPPVVTLAGLTYSPARKHEGDGPQTLVHYISGAQAGQAISINCSQVVLHEPKPGVITGFSPSHINYDGNLSAALTTITSNLDFYGLRAIMPLSCFNENNERFMHVLQLVKTEYCFSDKIDGNLQDTVDNIRESLNTIEKHYDTIPRASISSFFKKGFNWIKDKIYDPVVKPIFKPFFDMGKRLGMVGHNVLVNTAKNIANNIENNGDDILGGYINSQTGLPVYQQGQVNQNLIGDYLNEKAGVNIYKPRASNRVFSSPFNLPVDNSFITQYPHASLSTKGVGQLILNESNKMYNKNPKLDLATNDTSMPAIWVDKKDAAFFGVVNESNDSRDLFSGVVGGATYVVTYTDCVPKWAVNGLIPKNRVYNNVPTLGATWVPKRSMILMKGLRTCGDKIEVCCPLVSVVGRSWELAGWMLEHGFGGLNYMFSGSVDGSMIGHTPPDVAGLKKAVAKRCGLVFVANSELAQIKVDITGTLYHKLLLNLRGTVTQAFTEVENQIVDQTEWWKTSREKVKALAIKKLSEEMEMDCPELKEFSVVHSKNSSLVSTITFDDVHSLEVSTEITVPSHINLYTLEGLPYLGFTEQDRVYLFDSVLAQQCIILNLKRAPQRVDQSRLLYLKLLSMSKSGRSVNDFTPVASLKTYQDGRRDRPLRRNGVQKEVLQPSAALGSFTQENIKEFITGLEALNEYKSQLNDVKSTVEKLKSQKKKVNTNKLTKQMLKGKPSPELRDAMLKLNKMANLDSTRTTSKLFQTYYAKSKPLITIPNIESYSAKQKAFIRFLLCGPLACFPASMSPSIFSKLTPVLTETLLVLFTEGIRSGHMGEFDKNVLQLGLSDFNPEEYMQYKQIKMGEITPQTEPG